MTQTSFIYPFTAVLGQTSFKLALKLAAVNPLVGGVLISGPRGSAKSTLAKSLSTLLPQRAANGSPFVNLPLGTTEEMLIGSLSLNKVVEQQKVDFQPGLLAKAHGGILYVDEVNLLPDNLVDQLLDVAASGVNYVERDGVSHQHDAKFVLIGTMNPDEGELRPQLTDRFGLFVQLSNQFDVQDRIEVVTRREAFDQNPAEFIASYQQSQQDLQQQIEQAQQLLSDVQCDMALRKTIAQRCYDAQLDGLRGDIVWLQAARAHAALQGRTEVTEEDIFMVESFVLDHRRQQGGQPPSSSSQSSSSQNQPPSSSQRQPDTDHGEKKFQRPKAKDDSTHNRPQSLPEPDNSKGPASKSNYDSDNKQNSGNKHSSGNTKENQDWGALPPKAQKFEALSITDYAVTPSLKTQQQAGVKSSQAVRSFTSSAQTGDALGRKADTESSQKPHWFKTLAANAGQWPLQRWVWQPKRSARLVMHLFLLDTSGSVLSNQQFNLAKSLILKQARQAYLKREQVSIVGFGNDQSQLLLPMRRAPKNISDFLESIKAGGGTPFVQAVQHAVKIQQRCLLQQSKVQLHSYIITDGRVRLDETLPMLQGRVTVIDIENSAVKRGVAEKISQRLQAQYIPLAQLNAL
ncbi:AAA family ATPase [Reinekea thalattae]|uniref:VWA domain-containing protein n=1 Tax=Reinekea thalattae TaxID=2593301 RepID=A0A5C8Z8Q7_9GAMM|nr:AAA family ATPase [Reinekea thalattae]TXR53659.1 VWA domain-containing protein [Reinekea thalattae]